jgi:hypothetical protein
MRRYLIVSLAVVLSASAASAQTYYVDRFTDSFTQSAISSGTAGPTNQAITASDIFNRRTFTQTYLAGGGGAADTYTLGWDGANMQTSDASGVRGTFTNTYTVSGGNANFNAAGATGISFDVQILDFSQRLDMTITSGGNVATLSNFSVISTILNGGPYTINIPFASFTGVVTPSDIDQITFQITDLSINTQLQYDDIRLGVVAVPEPATIALMGLSGSMLGAGWYIRRRRNQKALNASFTRS